MTVITGTALQREYKTVQPLVREGEIAEKERTRLTQIVDSVHSISKKIRFWNCPDNEKAWSTYIKIGIDYLNTDHISSLPDILKTTEQISICLLRRKNIFLNLEL